MFELCSYNYYICLIASCERFWSLDSGQPYYVRTVGVKMWVHLFGVTFLALFHNSVTVLALVAPFQCNSTEVQCGSGLGMVLRDTRSCAMLYAPVQCSILHIAAAYSVGRSLHPSPSPQHATADHCCASVFGSRKRDSALLSARWMWQRLGCHP